MKTIEKSKLVLISANYIYKELLIARSSGINFEKTEAVDRRCFLR